MKEDQVRGFQLGADDYLTKPFDSELLLYKIQAVLKRNKEVEVLSSKVALGDFEFDPKMRTLSSEFEETRLSPKESSLLAMLCSYKNDVMPRSRALREIWKNEDYFTKRSMDVYIAKLRKHLSGDNKLRIENIHGEGYRLLENK